MANVEKVVAIGIPGIPGTRPDLGVACGNCPALFGEVVRFKRVHPDATEFHFRCLPRVGEGLSAMTRTIIYPENGSEVVVGDMPCGLK